MARNHSGRRRLRALTVAGTVVAAGLGLTSVGLAGAHTEEAEEPPHFTYEGKTRASRWGSIAPEYETCSAGSAQTPIDVVASEAEPSASTFELRYEPVKASVLNNGHTVQVVTEPGSLMVLDGAEYPLVQFHYHTPSEHTFDGRPYVVEWHFVHQTADGKTAVLAVSADLGAANPGFAPVLDAAPAREGKTKKLAATIDPSILLPEDRTAVGYEGSFTTPPCTEGVHWTLLVQPVEMGEDQVQELQNLLGPNARPLQPANGRRLVSRTAG